MAAIMSDAVIVALISGGVTLIGIIASYFSTIDKLDKQSMVADEKINGKINVISTEIKTLSNRVEKHNQIVERTYKLEERMAVAEERVSDAHHRINELRDDAK